MYDLLASGRLAPAVATTGAFAGGVPPFGSTNQARTVAGSRRKFCKARVKFGRSSWIWARISSLMVLFGEKRLHVAQHLRSCCTRGCDRRGH
jgi:hypothetical protein